MFTPPPLCVTCHVSNVMCQLSCITYQVSGVRCHVSHVTFFSSTFLTKCWSLLVEGLLSTGPTPSSFKKIPEQTCLFGLGSKYNEYIFALRRPVIAKNYFFVHHFPNSFGVCARLIYHDQRCSQPGN